jgi:hypothetical protein
LEVVAEGLNFPIGLDFGPDGALYVSLPALGATPGQGTIARLDLTKARIAPSSTVRQSTVDVESAAPSAQ